ncbi:MAG: tRNA threonylcarbamoyladenosine dehydratase [Bacteroidota bacterium]|nr:tRNA threonylcarbamoyladenosine dehydratase [Bacteroidota bacterium]
MSSENWLSRTELLIGKEGLERLRNSRVLIVGLGAVGSYAAEMICRSGVGNITIADGDTVHITNRNRQLEALKSTEGMSKAGLIAERLKDINPDLKLNVINEFLRDERIGEVLANGFDYVVDAIDTLSPKVFLLYEAVSKKYPVVSSMGAGGRVDPSRISISDLSQTTCCPLARLIRKKLHRLGITEGVTAVYSPEIVDKNKVIPVKEEQNKASIVGTICYMPAAFGIACASVVIRDLAGIPRF